jgi:hypothetical protein
MEDEYTFAFMLGIGVFILIVFLLYGSLQDCKRYVRNLRMRLFANNQSRGHHVMYDQNTSHCGDSDYEYFGNGENVDSDYRDFIASNSLEQSVYDSHNQFTTDANHRTSGASGLTIRTDDNDINPWVGLRRPNYLAVSTGDESRVVPSETPGQMPNPTRKVL